MYDSQTIALRIKQLAKNNKIVIKNMLEECGLSKNALSSMSAGGSTPKSENLAKIADYLNCSVDYLLGRTDTPKTSSENFTPSDTLESDFIRIFNDLSTEDKIRVLYQAVELKNKDKK